MEYDKVIGETAIKGDGTVLGNWWGRIQERWNMTV
jgi:hypothetical protein